VISRAGLAVAVVGVVALTTSAASARTPPVGNAIFVVRVDPRLCPSPRCGGYWLALANAARTRCHDGLRRPRCYAAAAVGRRGQPLGRLADGALVRGAIDAGHDDFGEVVTTALYAQAGTAAPTGGYYRLVDTGIRCVRAPCFSWHAVSVNAATRVRVSGIELRSATASAAETARAQAALASTNGLFARGRFVRRPDGGTVFRALRLYLRAPLPRA
jgi:hypothetical protein